MLCPNCKQEVWTLFPLGNKSYCGDCDKLIREKIISRIRKDTPISWLEQQMIFDLFVEMEKIGADIIFQHEISAETLPTELCALERWAEENFEDFKCPKHYYCFEECNRTDCKFYKETDTHEFIKYILDFAIFKNGKKLDLELDGKQFHQNKSYDSERNDYMESNGWVVLRYTYDEVMKDKNKIIKEIIYELNK